MSVMCKNYQAVHDFLINWGTKIRQNKGQIFLTIKGKHTHTQTKGNKGKLRERCVDLHREMAIIK